MDPEGKSGRTGSSSRAAERGIGSGVAHMHLLSGEEKASLVTAGTVLFRGTLSECLARWVALPEGARASAHVEFPTMTRGCYSLDTRDLNGLHRRLGSKAL